MCSCLLTSLSSSRETTSGLMESAQHSASESCSPNEGSNKAAKASDCDGLDPLMEESDEDVVIIPTPSILFAKRGPDGTRFDLDLCFLRKKLRFELC